MSAFSATILISAKENTKAIFDSINTDNKFYPENPTKTKISLKKNNLQISIESDELPHLRANINSLLRLIQASHDSLESAKDPDQRYR
jgi:KEOPS complex subunit Pcc1